MRGYLKLSKQEVMFNADKLYLNTVAKKEIYNLAIEYRDVVNDFVNVIKSKVEEEVVGKNVLYQSKVRLNDAQYQVLKAAKDFEMSIMDLNKLLGFPVDTLPRVADSLMPLVKSFSADSLIVRALKNRPELTYLNGKAMATKYNEKVTVSKFKPQFGALAGGKWGAPSPGLKTDPDFNYYFKAQLKIPIYYWGQKQNEYNAVRQATQIAQLRVEQTKDAVVLQVQRSYYNLEKSQEQMKFAKSALNNAKKNVSVMLDRYNEGLSSVLEVLDAQAFLQKSFLNYIEAKYDVNVVYSEYMHALGEMAK
jgi:outer membrane protein TolC